jgi:hypothetical protein
MNPVLFFLENPVLRKVYRGFASIARIIPYYLMKEYLLDEDELDIQPRLGPLDVELLGVSDIETLMDDPEILEDKEELLQRFQDGCLCLGLKHEGKVAAFCWCDPGYFQFKKVKHKLKENEAYLFDIRTFQAYRGKNLAPYLRYQLYKHLTQKGLTHFYSLTMMLNTSSERFKRKLGAKRYKLYVYVCFFNTFYMNIPIKTYFKD